MTFQEALNEALKLINEQTAELVKSHRNDQPEALKFAIRDRLNRLTSIAEALSEGLVEKKVRKKGP